MGWCLIARSGRGLEAGLLGGLTGEALTRVLARRLLCRLRLPWVRLPWMGLPWMGLARLLGLTLRWLAWLWWESLAHV